MSSPSSSSLLLVIPSHWTSFGVAFVHRLVSYSSSSPATTYGCAKMFVLYPYAEEGVPRGLLEHIERGSVRIEFGTPGNGRLVTKLVQQHQICTVFLLLSDDACELGVAEGIATRTRTLLRPLCALLECLRQCEVRPMLCTVVDAGNTRGAEFLVEIFAIFEAFQFANKCDAPGGLSRAPVVQCASEASARFSSVHALLHSYSVSYRMNVQIVLIQQPLDNAQKTEKAMNFVMEIVHKEGGEKGKIIHSFCQMDAHFATTTEQRFAALPCVPYARVLLFGTSPVVQNAMMTTSLRALVPGTWQPCVATCRPGLDTDEAVEEEIVDHGPSHVIFVHGADNETCDAWEAGGPANLQDNVRNNLFSPWLLAQICDRFGINFVEFNGEAKSCCQSNGKMSTNADELKMSRYAVVRHFGDQLCQLKVISD